MAVVGGPGESRFRGLPGEDAAVTSERLGRTLDLASRGWWRLVGRRVDLDGDHRWLDAPTCGPGPVGATWLRAEAERLGGFVREDVSGGGLLPSMSVLDGAGFRAADLDQTVHHFYEHTACWRMKAWAQWSALFQPGGELVSPLGGRVQQLALPTRPLDVAHGMDSRVVHLMDANGEQHAAGWLRTLSATGQFVYSGCYVILAQGGDRWERRPCFSFPGADLFPGGCRLGGGTPEGRSDRGRQSRCSPMSRKKALYCSRPWSSIYTLHG